MAVAGDDFTLAHLGEHLGVDATAVYRHFRTKDELLRSAADRILSTVTDGLETGDGSSTSVQRPWRDQIVELCERLRAVHLAHPSIAALASSGPPRGTNEFVLTEMMLGALARAGLLPRAAAQAYHAVIELTVGAAVIDAPIASAPESSAAREYERWRDTYRHVDPGSHPHLVAHADELYQGTADERFRRSLDWLLDGIAAAAGDQGVRRLAGDATSLEPRS